MPKIKTDSQQIEALKQIEELIQDSNTLNMFLDQKELVISMGTGKKMISRSIDTEDIKKYLDLLKKAKERNAKKAFTLSEKFRIELSEEDNCILGLSDNSSQSPSEEEISDCVNNNSEHGQEY